MKHVGTSAAPTDIATRSQIPVAGPVAVLTNNTVATTETVVARFALPAAFLVANSVYTVDFSGQVSSTATNVFRVRIGALGTTTDTLAATFITSAAGVANQHIRGSVLIRCITAGLTGTAAVQGNVWVGAATLAVVAAVTVTPTINTTVPLFVSITHVQSIAQTYTSRIALFR